MARQIQIKVTRRPRPQDPPGPPTTDPKIIKTWFPEGSEQR